MPVGAFGREADSRAANARFINGVIDVFLMLRFLIAMGLAPVGAAGADKL
jgi:hypothetical protein